MDISGQTLSPSRARTLYLVGGGVTLAALMAGHILNERRRLRRASHPGRAVSASVSTSGPMLTTFNRAGQSGDPINIQIIGSDGQVGASFAAAGWYRADEIDLLTSARISADSILGRTYSTAPVSNLYLYGRKEDYAFERPGKSVRQRDHIRLWNTGHAADDRRPIWIGSATRDIKSSFPTLTTCQHTASRPIWTPSASWSSPSLLRPGLSSTRVCAPALARRHTASMVAAIRSSPMDRWLS